MSSRKEINVSIRHMKKKFNQSLERISFKKKTNKVEKMINGINMMPAPFGVGVLWLLLWEGLSIKGFLLKKLMVILSKNMHKKNKQIGIKNIAIF
jgi:hypothetical protein